jgi:DNA-binding LacI/PurR family transcriptional regulator
MVKHTAIAEELRDKIRRRELDGRLPPQTEMARDFDVNPTTMGKALRTLADEGLLRRKPGLGTFVAESAVRHVTLAVMMGELKGPLHARILSAIQGEAAADDAEILIRATRLSEDDELVHLRRYINGKHVEGLILWSVTDALVEHLKLLRGVAMPFVAVVSPGVQSDREFSYVTNDDFHGGALAVAHLAGLGHRRIAWVEPPAESGRTVHTLPRWEGCRHAMRARGLPLVGRVVARGQVGTGPLPAETVAELRQFTGLVCYNDDLAWAAIQGLRAAGARVPEDVSVVGYDDVAVAQSLGITTVHQPIEEIGVEAVRILLERIEDPDLPPVHRCLKPELIIRKTTGPAAPRAPGIDSAN